MAVTFNWYDDAIRAGSAGPGNIVYGADTFVMMLMTSAHAFAQANTQRSQVQANELATGNGYTQGAKQMASVTWTQTGGVTKFDFAPVTWTAAGGPIGPARHATLYSDTSTNDLLVNDIDFGQDETAGDGTDFKITPNAGGWFTIN